MSEQTNKPEIEDTKIPIYIMGKRYDVPPSLTIMKAMEWAGYSSGSAVGTTAVSTDQPTSLSSTTTSFGRGSSNTGQANGYIRDVYLSLSAVPAGRLVALSDLMNRW